MESIDSTTKGLRRLGCALWLALALLVGQQAAVRHALAHSLDRVETEKHFPAPAACDECLAGAALSAGVAPTLAAVPIVAASPPHTLSRRTLLAPRPARLAFHSRAPPAALL